VPVGDGAVCDSRGDVKHNDRALTLDAAWRIRARQGNKEDNIFALEIDA
jgi:hypothetical protein